MHHTCTTNTKATMGTRKEHGCIGGRPLFIVKGFGWTGTTTINRVSPAVSRLHLTIGGYRFLQQCRKYNNSKRHVKKNTHTKKDNHTHTKHKTPPSLMVGRFRVSKMAPSNLRWSRAALLRRMPHREFKDTNRAVYPPPSARALAFLCAVLCWFVCCHRSWRVLFGIFLFTVVQ